MPSVIAPSRPMQAAPPNPRAMLQGLAVQSVEVLAGLREIGQLSGRLEAPARRSLQLDTLRARRRPRTGAPRRPQTTVRSCHLQWVRRDAVEAVVVVDLGDRVRAVATRLELRGSGQWRARCLRVL